MSPTALPPVPARAIWGTPRVSTRSVCCAEIKLSGKITKAWGFEVMLDPAKTQNLTAGNDDKILQDLAVSFGLKGHEIAIGQKKIAMTEEGLRSSSDPHFSERSRITRVIGDQRQAGFFYKGEFSKLFAAQASS